MTLPGITVFDVETNGKANVNKPADDPCQPRIVQLAMVMIDIEGRVYGRFNSLIKPDGWVIPPEVQAIHNINIDQCNAFGIPIQAAVAMFDDFVSKSSFVVAHNADFDVLLMQGECARLKWPDPFDGTVAVQCTMQSGTNLCKIRGPRGYKWPKLAELHLFLFHEEIVDAHDAMGDVLSCMKCYLEMKRRGVI